MSHKHLQELASTVDQAIRASRRLAIKGCGSKRLYSGDQASLDLCDYRGIVSYDPAELVVTVRAGTTVSDLQAELTERQQELAFDPPHYDGHASIGGTIACGLSGPGRPFLGAARDAVLGIKMINGLGELLNFGGQVMKNVAGYDIARMMCGSMGNLGAIVEVSLRVMPCKTHTQTLAFDMTMDDAIEFMNRQAGLPLPLTAASWYQERCYLRLAGAEAAVAAAANRLGGELIDADDYWPALREHTLTQFVANHDLWRLHVPATTQLPPGDGDWLVDWCGGQRWLRASKVSPTLIEKLGKCGGRLAKFRNRLPEPRQPEPGSIRWRLRAAFDPNRVFAGPGDE